MKPLTLDPKNVRESLQYRAETGHLAKETAILRVVYEMIQYSTKYTQKQKDNVLLVLKLSREVLKKNKQKLARLTAVEKQQARIYPMFGPDFGFLPSSAVNQPADFYIDMRCGRTKFPRKQIYKEVRELVKLANKAKLNAHDMPKLHYTHNCGVW